MSAEFTGVTSKSIARSPWMLIPPPLLFVVPLVLGILLNRSLPLPLLPESLSSSRPWLAGVFLALFLATAAHGIGRFVRAHTTIIPHARPNALVTSGPYRLSRNPMYIGLTCVYLGLTVLANTLWPLPFLLFPLWVLQTKVIPYEEQMLTSVFGSEYIAYTARVRRWL